MKPFLGTLVGYVTGLTTATAAVSATYTNPPTWTLAAGIAYVVALSLTGFAIGIAIDRWTNSRDN